jgi:acetolactate synthase-1/3 small subunit
MNQEYTLSVFSEDHIGILNQITIILTRRQINIDSITASESAVKGVHLITIVVRSTPDMIQKVVRQMEKVIDVLKVFAHTSEEIVYQEIALFKVSTKVMMSGNIVDNIIRNHNGRFVEVTPEYMVIEKTGHRDEILDLLHILEKHGILQFVRSGRVAITRQVKELNSYLKEMDSASRSKIPEASLYN